MNCQMPLRCQRLPPASRYFPAPESYIPHHPIRVMDSDFGVSADEEIEDEGMNRAAMG